MKYFFLFFFCIVNVVCFSQAQFPFFINNKGVKKVVADTLITRIAPSAGAAFEDSLYIGDSVEIVMQVPFIETRNNINSPWLKVMYKSGRYKKMGFISSMDLAIQTTKYKGYEFLWGLVKNIKTDSIINNDLIIKNSYECKIIALEKGKKVSSANFIFDNNKPIDSFSFKPLEKVNLDKTIAGIELQQFNTKDTAREYYTNTFILCKSKSLCALPITHNYSHTTVIPFPVSSFIFSKNKFSIKTDYLRMMPENINDEYKWENCNYILK